MPALQPSQVLAEPSQFASYGVRPLTAEQSNSPLVRLLDETQLQKIVRDSRDAALDKAVTDRKAADEAQSSRKDKNLRYYDYDLATMNRFAEQFKQMEGRCPDGPPAATPP